MKKIRDKKDQKFFSSVSFEVEVFNMGSEYWKQLYLKGEQQKILTYSDIELLKLIERYSNGLVASLPSSKFKELRSVLQKLEENGIR